jgi:hypothetical protein
MQTLAPATDTDPDDTATPYFAPSPARYRLMVAEMDRMAAARAQSAA